MARPKKTETVVADAVKLISAKKLSDLMKLARATKQEVDDCTEGLKEALKDAATNHNLHKKAFASVKAADRMEPEALADYFAHRDFYEETLGLRKRASSVMRMDLGGAENVTNFPGQAAE